MWEDFKGLIKNVLILLLIAGISLYFFIFGMRNSLDEMVFQEVYQTKYIFKNEISKTSYNRWLSDKIESEMKK